MNNLIISSENGGLIYHVIYQISFLLGLSIFLIAGHQRKIPFSSLLLIGALTGCLLIAGTKVGTYGLDEWNYLFTHGAFPVTGAKTILTGILATVLALIVSEKLFKYKSSLLDASAFIFPVVMILQRFGCLFAGCCYGNPTAMPWGLQYADHYKIYGRHLAEGVAGCGSGLSAPVHPVQVYEMLGYLLIIAVLWRFRRRFRAANSFGLFSLALVFAMRFLVEFFRDPVTNHGWGETWAGLKIVQWFVLCVVLIAGLWIYFLEKNGGRRKAYNAPEAPPVKKEILLAGLLTGFLWLTHGWFTPLETVVFQTLVLCAVVSLAVAVFRSQTTPRFRWAMLSLVGISLIFMSQTVEIEGLKNPEKSKNKQQFKIGYLQGNMDHDFIETTKEEKRRWVTTDDYDDDCDGEDGYWQEYTEITKDEIQISSLRGFGAEFQRATMNEHGTETTWGIGFSKYGYKKIVNDVAEKSVGSFSLFTWFGKEERDFGWKTGIQFGDLHFLGKNKEREKGFLFTNDKNSFISREGKTWIYPIVQLRLGPRNKFFCELGMGDDLPYGIAVSRFRGGLGFGNELFGIDYPFRVSGGMMQYIETLAFYADSEVGLGQKFFVSPAIRFGDQPLVSVGLGLKF